MEKANKLHAELLEKKKIHGIWWENFHAAAKRMHEASKALYFGEATEEAVANWKAEMARGLELQKQEPPVEPDQTEWMFARQDAMEEICREAGLRMRLDL
jgi:hypothetical protein